jgi:hypothetical protein
MKPEMLASSSDEDAHSDSVDNVILVDRSNSASRLPGEEEHARDNEVSINVSPNRSQTRQNGSESEMQLLDQGRRLLAETTAELDRSSSAAADSNVRSAGEDGRGIPHASANRNVLAQRAVADEELELSKQGSSRYFSQKTCRNCGEVGHLQRDCPEKVRY